MDSPKPPKNVEESQIYSQNKLQITEDIKALDDAMAGIIYAIASKPEEFAYADEALGIKIANCMLGNGIPFTVYFKEHDTKIVLLDIELTKEDELPF